MPVVPSFSDAVGAFYLVAGEEVVPMTCLTCRGTGKVDLGLAKRDPDDR
jgi:hypothetical protein